MTVLCGECGSNNVRADGALAWSVTRQDWVLMSVYDDMSCEACGYEGRNFNHVPRAPDSIPFATAFKQVLKFVVECGYSTITVPELASLDDRKTDLANAIVETLDLLGYQSPEETGDWLGDMYDLAEEVGFVLERQE